MDKGKNKIITKKITVWGTVQGVGFRPFVFRLAQKHNLFGTVRNYGGIVEIILQSNEKAVNNFLKELEAENNKTYVIKDIKIEDIENTFFSDFKIIESNKNELISNIPTDLPVCDNCRRELFYKNDRRLFNPFISCTLCGPRYTIIDSLPYDRDNTTMQDFRMCELCQREYTSPSDRRFHAQTISCHDCGPYLIFKSDEEKLYKNEALDEAIRTLKSGGIVAVKGIGGYHFCCSPFIEEAVLNLRRLKGREEKPFAVMFEDIDSIKEYCEVSEEETKLLKSEARPIVLLYSKDKTMAYSTSMGSIYCGAFLPYTPLQIMLIKSCGPLIMTSANLSDNPIIKDDIEMLSVKSPLLNGVLYHTRRILRSVDDSVTKVIDKSPQIIRRSRGYVPTPIALKNSDKEILALGGDLKAAFCLYKAGNAVVSQYFGDLENVAILNEYKNSISNLSGLLNIKPKVAVCDLHPNYHSSKFAKSLDIPVISVQHHHAHIASVMAEHNLKEIIGVAFDGTGYGTDGNIWGGEFLACKGADFLRTAHLNYTPLIGGDQSMKDAKKTATCFLINSDLYGFIDDDRKDVINAAISSKINTVLSSSMGRLFDAVSSVLDISHENRYEGECAILLEKEAYLALKNNEKPQNLSFTINENGGIIESKELLKEICELKTKVSRGSIALGFHFAVADMILNVCKKIRNDQKINTVALGGGVFQNSILLERTLNILRQNDFDVYINRNVPPNDGCISLGQTYIALMR